jgi:hypothetical protein
MTFGWRPGTVGLLDTPPRATESPSLTVEDLRGVGFSDAEIAHLTRCRDSGAFPYRDFVDNRQQFDRLIFARWRYLKGLLR